MERERMNQVIRELKRQFAGEKLAPEQLKGLIRAGYVYSNGDEHVLTDKGRAQPGVYPREADQRSDGASKAGGLGRCTCLRFGQSENHNYVKARAWYEAFVRPLQYEVL
jgi:hypothetical protein